MLHSRKRVLAFALALFLLLPSFTGVRATDAAAIADEPLTETPEAAVPAIETPAPVPSDTIEAETELSLSDAGIRVIKGESKSLLPEPEQTRGEAALGTSNAANPLTAAGVVWTSSDPTVATVDSTGTVTAHELGEATITATLNGEVVQTFAVYSTLADGYYTMTAYAYGFDLCVDAISIQPNIGLMPLDEGTISSDLHYMLGPAWYFQYQDNGYYSIHPAHSREMVLYIFGGVFPLVTRVSTLSSNNWHWKLVSGYYGYALQNRAFDDVTFAFNDSSIYNATVEAVAFDVSDEYQGWAINVAPPLQGILLFNLLNGTIICDTWNDYTIPNVGYAPLNIPTTFDELNLSLSIVDTSNTSQAFSMTFHPSNSAEYSMGYGTITATQLGVLYATVQRAMGNSLQTLTFKLDVKNLTDITVKYDGAYLNRYSSNTLSRINQMTQAAKAKFYSLGILVDFSSPVQFQSAGDLCSTNYAVNCTCSSSPCPTISIVPTYIDAVYGDNFPTTHHKNLYNIFAHAIIENTSTSLQYIGHNICYDDGVYGHIIYGDGSGRYIHGMAKSLKELQECDEYTTLKGLAQVYDHISLAHATATTVHELGHLFGTIDHYGNSYKSTEQMNLYYKCDYFSENCIYGENKENGTIVNDITICEGCRRILTNTPLN